MRQRTSSSAVNSGFEKYRKPTRKEKFLTKADAIIPWKELCEAIEPHQPKGAGRRSVDTERMLRIHFLQHWFNLSDSEVEDALYDFDPFRHFAGIDLNRESVPDETTVREFRHFMERHNLGQGLFDKVNTYLHENGMRLSGGEMVEAILTQAPGSIESEEKG